jgi:hypothetical protein
MIEHIYYSQAVRASAVTPARTSPQPPSQPEAGTDLIISDQPEFALGGN